MHTPREQVHALAAVGTVTFGLFSAWLGYTMAMHTLDPLEPWYVDWAAYAEEKILYTLLLAAFSGIVWYRTRA